jgi:hypothetical protein
VTLTIKPPELDERQHARAEAEGWSIFLYDEPPRARVCAIDELGIITDAEALLLARRMGLEVDDDGFLLTKLKEEDSR